MLLLHTNIREEFIAADVSVLLAAASTHWAICLCSILHALAYLRWRLELPGTFAVFTVVLVRNPLSVFS